MRLVDVDAVTYETITRAGDDEAVEVILRCDLESLPTVCCEECEWWRRRAETYHTHFRRCLTELDGGKFRSTDEYMRTCPAWVGCGGECDECSYPWQTTLEARHD